MEIRRELGSPRKLLTASPGPGISKAVNKADVFIIVQRGGGGTDGYRDPRDAHRLLGSQTFNSSDSVQQSDLSVLSHQADGQSSDRLSVHPLPVTVIFDLGHFDEIRIQSKKTNHPRGSCLTSKDSRTVQPKRHKLVTRDIGFARGRVICRLLVEQVSAFSVIASILLDFICFLGHSFVCLKRNFVLCLYIIWWVKNKSTVVIRTVLDIV